MSNKKPIRVLMVTPFPDTEDKIVGGVTGVAYYLCKHLAEIPDITVDVLVPDSACATQETRVISEIKITYLPIIKQHPIARVLFPKVAPVIGDFAEQGGYDLVHIQAAPEWSSHIKQPIITTIHGINEQDMLFRGGNALKRKMLWPLIRLSEQIKRASIDNLIVINPYVRSAIGKAFKGRSWDIENPVREDFFHVAREVEPNTILFAGVVTSRKNVARLIQAMEKVRESIPNAKLRIAGSLDDQNYSNHCLAEVERLQLQDNIEFLGNLSIDEMKKQLRQSQIMALVSLQETAPLSIEEAMAAGMPVVASNICGIPFMIQDGVTGALVDPMNIDSIAKGIVTALQLNLPDAAKTSTEIAHKRFRGKVVAKQTASTYREVLELDMQSL